MTVHSTTHKLLSPVSNLTKCFLKIESHTNKSTGQHKRDRNMIYCAPLCVLFSFCCCFNTDVNFPSLVPTSLLQSQLIVASLVPISFFILFFLAAVAITITCHFSRRKKRELEFHRSVIDRHVDVLEILLEKLPQDPSGRVYVQMLQVVERILTIHLDENPSTQPSLNEDRLQEESTIELEAIELPFSEMSVKSTALIKTLGNVIERGRQNPKLRPHLDRQMSTIIDRQLSTITLDQPGTPFSSHHYHFTSDITAAGDYTDTGYAGSSTTDT